MQFNPPASAGPLNTSFDLRAAVQRRTTQAMLPKSQLGAGAGEDQVPMTAALGGKFGSRTLSLGTNALSRFNDENDDGSFNPPPTPGATTVISGGTSLGNPASNNVSTAPIPIATIAPSKSDAAVSWRRGGLSNSVLGKTNPSPSVRVSPPPSEQRVSPPPARLSPPPARLSPPPGRVSPSALKSRPMPLRFNNMVSQPMAAVEVDTSNDPNTDNDDADSTGSSKSGGGSNASSPTTPRSTSSNDMALSLREEAAKKLYEGLGIGRPMPAPLAAAPSMVSYRMVSQPMRQPRGPPSGSDELGPMNFATRIRRKAIGGLGMLMGARERREIVELY